MRQACFMRIRFAKSRQGPVLICTRDDGSVTGMKDPNHGGFFVRHDLVHYAVETVLGFRNAFWGLVAGFDGANPWSLESFNVAGAAKRLPEQAIAAEFIVGLIDQAMIVGQEPMVAADLNRDLHLAHPRSMRLRPLAITQEQLDLIVHRFMNLFTGYQSIPEGGYLELEFPSSTGSPVPARDPADDAARGWPRATVRGMTVVRLGRATVSPSAPSRIPP